MTDRSSLRAALIEVAASPLPLPGSGQTALRLEELTAIAHCDLELARLAEAHHDAQAIAGELGGALPPGVLYGVWAASGPDPLVATRCAHGFRLEGTVPWCTGVGIVDRALVTARDAGSDKRGLLFDLEVAAGRIDELAPPWLASAFATTGTSTLRFELEVGDDALLGSPGRYLDRPGFWHGAICVSACWAGGLAGLVEMYTRQWTRQDPHSLAHLGSAAAWVSANSAVLRQAAQSIDTEPFGRATAEMRARSVRHVIERACTMAMDDLAVGAGPAPLAFDGAILDRVRQLQLYIRQCHGERDLEPLGKWLVSLDRNDD